MTRKEFTDTIVEMVQGYIDNPDGFDSNPQIRVNPMTLAIDYASGGELLAAIEDSNEAVESAAGANGAREEDTGDYQVKRNPDFYSISSLVRRQPSGTSAPAMKAIEAMADTYFK